MYVFSKVLRVGLTLLPFKSMEILLSQGASPTPRPSVGITGSLLFLRVSQCASEQAIGDGEVLLDALLKGNCNYQVSWPS